MINKIFKQYAFLNKLEIAIFSREIENMYCGYFDKANKKYILLNHATNQIIMISNNIVELFEFLKNKG